MKSSPSLFFKTYFGLFHFIAEKRLAARDLSPTTIHIILTIVLTTCILMWAYVILAYTSLTSSTPFVVGAIASAAHLFSPLILRYSKSAATVGNILLFAGMVHQATFSYFTGGFLSPTLIWYGILPMLGGLIDGKRGLIIWGLSTLIIPLCYLSLELYGYSFPNEITTNGRLVSQMLIVFGWIFLSTTIISVFIYMKSTSEKLLAVQGKKIDDLVRVLFHDLANPLGRISIGLNITKKNDNPDQTQRGIDIASQATEAMIEITQNVRKMYAISKGKADMDLVPFSLVEGIQYVRKVCGEELEKKKIIIDFDQEKYRDIFVQVEPVSFKNQVLCNLISNAIKFSGEGKTITITAEVIQKKYIQICIADEGIGMPNSILTNLFDINSKTSRTGTRGETGTGFGMHIMKSFMEMYEGEVTVESIERTKDNPRSGTTFKLLLRGPCL
jgi:signal transduction histidine kinase